MEYTFIISGMIFVILEIIRRKFIDLVTGESDLYIGILYLISIITFSLSSLVLVANFLTK